MLGSPVVVTAEVYGLKTTFLHVVQPPRSHHDDRHHDCRDRERHKAQALPCEGDEDFSWSREKGEAFEVWNKELALRMGKDPFRATSMGAKADATAAHRSRLQADTPHALIFTKMPEEAFKTDRNGGKEPPLPPPFSDHRTVTERCGAMRSP